ncbi:MAG: cyclase family protein [Clostridiales bacterium]|nr:cyclase family protein [Clostridiales bacterium]
MKKYIDLSRSIVNDMPVYPYDDKVRLFQDKFLDKDKYVNHRLEIGMHSGTHIDTPMHMTESSAFIGDMPLERFAGRGVLLDARNERIIKYKDFYSDMVGKDDIVLVYTGHGDLYGTGEYFTDQPVIDEGLADFFVEKKIKMLGVDMPSPDNYPFIVHKKLFSANILIIENLTNLSELIGVKAFEVIAFPLKVRAEASMARVAACIII